jgi:hypothetical protein
MSESSLPGNFTSRRQHHQYEKELRPGRDLSVQSLEDPKGFPNPLGSDSTQSWEDHLLESPS